mgnify:CR=1 FL=1
MCSRLSLPAPALGCAPLCTGHVVVGERLRDSFALEPERLGPASPEHDRTVVVGLDLASETIDPTIIVHCEPIGRDGLRPGSSWR